MPIEISRRIACLSAALPSVDCNMHGHQAGYMDIKGDFYPFDRMFNILQTHYLFAKPMPVTEFQNYYGLPNSAHYLKRLDV